MLHKTGQLLVQVAIVVFLITCSNRSGLTTENQKNDPLKQDTIKTYRNSQTEALYKNLKRLSVEGKIMFGMANPTSIGYINGPKNNNENQSDCKDITGSHPAYYESDIMWYSDSVFKKADMKAMRAAYKRGAVCGYCWHIRGKASDEFYAKKEGKFSEDKDLVLQILESSDRKTNKALDWYFSEIDNKFLPVIKELNFPLVFRPFHEMNGNWFWWGTDNCSPSEYQQLYRLTVDYLRQNKIDNLLYAWSVNVDVSFDYYPGDEYVEILGLDSYEPGIVSWNPTEKFINSLGELTDFAEKHNKVAALTETGCRKDNEHFRYTDQYPEFWTKNVLNPIIGDKKAKKIVWIMSWYNADWNHNLKGQFYIPYLGMKRPNSKKAIIDFLKFYNSEHILFEKNLPKMYN